MTDDEKKTNEGSEPAENEAPKEPNAHEAHQEKSNLGKKKLIAICASALAVVAITVGIIIAVTSGNHGGGNAGRGNSGGGDENPPCEHTFGDWITETEATCTEDGEKYRECTLCSEKETETVAATGHTEVIDASVDATCKKTGLTEGKHCSACGEVLVAQIETPLTVHTYDNSNDDTCNVCDFVRDLSCKHVNTEIIYGYDATCTTSGLSNGKKCTSCGDIIVSQNRIPAGHKEVVDEAVAATCNSIGLTEGKHCSACGDVLVEQEIVQVTPHIFANGEYIDDTKNHNLNDHPEIRSFAETYFECETVMLGYVQCSYCREVIDINVNVEHNFEYMLIEDTSVEDTFNLNLQCTRCPEGINVKQLSASDLNVLYRYEPDGCMKGQITYSYKVNSDVTVTCDVYFGGNGQHIFASGEIIDWTKTYNVNDHPEIKSFAETYFECETVMPGYVKCSYCGEVINLNVNVEHNIVNGTCTRCGEGEASSIQAGLYDANDNLVASWDTLVNTYGMDVSKDYNALNYNTTASSPYYVLTNKTELSGGVKLVIDNEVTKIGEWAFCECISLTSVSIGNSVTSVGSRAFEGCKSLRSITIPDSVTSIGYEAFYGCGSLTYTLYNNAIYLGNANNSYVALIEANNTGITYCNIHPNTQILAGGAFENCTNLTNVTIGNRMKSISNSTFYSCTSLTSMTIPDSVTYIGDYAFANCHSLTICCEASSKPSGWDSNWNPSSRPVVWGYTGK